MSRPEAALARAAPTDPKAVAFPQIWDRKRPWNYARDRLCSMYASFHWNDYGTEHPGGLTEQAALLHLVAGASSSSWLATRRVQAASGQELWLRQYSGRFSERKWR
jgi:hypothetical protein